MSASTRQSLCALLPCAALLAACSGELREERVDPSNIWGDAVEQAEIEEPIVFVERTDLARYGLPRAGNPGIGALIDILPDSGQAFDDPDIWIAPGEQISTDQCRGGQPNVVDALPITVEAVVTLHPRQYLKLPVCGQDERNYGNFTLEDDTGGIVLIRDSRVAPFTFGDRVLVTAKALTLTFGADADTRAILVADVERVPPLVNPETGAPERTVLFSRQVGPFADADVGQVKRIDGWVMVQPTNQNFNAMVVASQPPPISDRMAGQGDAVCMELCRGACRTGCGGESVGACEAQYCNPLCAGAGNQFDDAALPICWPINIDAELGRRGFSPEAGRRVTITGPVVNSFGRTIWVIRKGQVEVLE